MSSSGWLASGILEEACVSLQPPWLLAIMVFGGGGGDNNNKMTVNIRNQIAPLSSFHDMYMRQYVYFNSKECIYNMCTILIIVTF